MALAKAAPQEGIARRIIKAPELVAREKSEHLKRVEKMQQLAQQGKWKEGMMVGAEVGRERSTLKAKKLILETNHHVDKMGYSQDANGVKQREAGIEADNHDMAVKSMKAVNELVEDGFDGISDQQFKDKLLTRVDSLVKARPKLAEEWEKMTPDQKADASKKILEDPKMRSLLVSELHAVQEGFDFDTQAETLIKQKAEAQKTIDSLESNLPAEKTTIENLNKEFSENFSTDAEKITSSKASKLKNLEEDKDGRTQDLRSYRNSAAELKLNLQRAKDMKRTSGGNNYDQDIQNFQGKLDIANKQIKTLEKQQNEYLQLVREREQLQKDIREKQTQYDNHKTQVDTSKATITDVDGKFAQAKQYRDDQETLYATTLDHIVDNAADVFLEQRAQSFVTEWGEHMDAVAEQMLQEEHAEAAKISKEAEDKKREHDLKIAAVIRKRYIKTEKQVVKKAELGWKFVQGADGLLHWEVKKPAVERWAVNTQAETIEADYNTFFPDDETALNGLVDTIYGAANLPLPGINTDGSDTPERSQAKALLARENMRLRISVKGEQEGLPTDAERQILADKPWFENIIDYGVNDPKIRAALETETGLIDPEEAKDLINKNPAMMEKIKDATRNKGQVLMLILGLTFGSSMLGGQILQAEEAGGGAPGH